MQRQGFTALRELEMDGRQRRGGAMFDGERELISEPTQVEIAITPRMELGRATQRLTFADAGTTLFGVVNDEHGEVVTSLQLAQVCQKRATSPLAFSSMRCRRTNGSNTNSLGLSCSTVFSSLARSVGRSSRTVGAVIT